MSRFRLSASAFRIPSSVFLLLLLILTGCTAITLPDDTRIIRVGYGVVIQYQHTSQSAIAGTVEQTAIGTHSNIDPDTLRAIVHDALRAYNPSPFKLQ